MFHTLFQITVKQFPTAKSTFPLTKAPSPVTSGGVRLRPLGFAPDIDIRMIDALAVKNVLNCGTYRLTTTHFYAKIDPRLER